MPPPAEPALLLAVRVREALAEHGDPDRAVAQQRYMKSTMPYRGLTTPELRAIVRAILADRTVLPPTASEWERAVRMLWDGASHREERYAALAVARHHSARSFRQAGALALYRYLIESGAWWDLVDEIATHLVRDELLGAPVETAPVMRAWAVDPHMWVRRAAILCQVGAKDRLDRALLRDVIVPNLEGSTTAEPDGRHDFFIRKAIGWALRDASYRFADDVVRFVDEHRHAMAGLTIRESMRRIDRVREGAA